MEPFVVNPEGYNKEVAVKAAGEYVEAFLDHNEIRHVDHYLFAPDESRKPPGQNPWHDNGWYWQGTLFVNLKRSRYPVKNPGFAWSFTGFKADLTAPGILAHETGHHIHHEIDKKIDYKHRRIMLDCLRGLAKAEAAVSGYEPNPYEVMAEACRLFILNPVLLAEGRPKRYAFLIGLGLKPLHNVPWRDVLKHAHPRLVKAAENWILK